MKKLALFAAAVLFTAAPLVSGVIALMLVFMFRSITYMFITVINLPFAVAGGVFALVARGLPFSIPARGTQRGTPCARGRRCPLRAAC